MTPTLPDSPVQTSAPPTSPTGKAVVSQVLTRVALFVFGVAGAIALAPTAGIDISFLPPLVPKYCALIAFVALTMGLAGPGIRKAAPVVLLCLALTGCATTPPIVISARSLAALDITFVATHDAMEVAFDAHHITPAQYAAWKSFGLRYQASEGLAVKLYDAAAAAHDTSTQAQVSAILASFESELGTYAALALQVVHPDGGS